jgi:two-component system, LytTR family, response regulator
MIKAIIVDDEQSSLDLVENLVNKFFSKKIVVVDKCDNIPDALESIRRHTPDLLFLDVEIKGVTSFELLKQIDYNKLDTIFITAHPEYAIDAIKYSALDYVLKPLDVVSFLSAVKRCLSKISSKDQMSSLQMILEGFEVGSFGGSKVPFTTDTGYRLVNYGTIVRCEADVNYCRVYLVNDTSFIVSKTLKHVEALLPSSSFVRCHKSHLVNIKYIKEYIRQDGGFLILTDNQRIPVSNRKRQEVTNQLFSMLPD